MGLRRWGLLFVLITAVAVGACARTPEQAVRLSEIVQSNIKDVHAKHVALAHAFFEERTAKFDDWFRQIYEPGFFAKYEKEWNRRNANDTFSFAKPKHRTTYGSDLIAEYEELVRQIHAERDKLVTSLHQAYESLEAANASIVELLKSQRELSEVQMQLWNRTAGKLVPELNAGLIDAKIEEIRKRAIAALGG